MQSELFLISIITQCRPIEVIAGYIKSAYVCLIVVEFSIIKDGQHYCEQGQHEKISITTIICIKSYGSLLQAFATQKKLEEYADEVELFNYIQNTRLADWVKGRTNPIKALLAFINLMRLKLNFNRLKRDSLNLSSRSYSTEADFKQFKGDSDIYCIGSDQIWNFDCIPRMLPCARFLSFLPSEARRFSFSSSFGKDSVDEDTVKRSKEYLSLLERVSVREDSGVDILRKQYGRDDAVQLVDPTLAMPPEFWRSYATKPRIKGEYLLIFCLKRSKELDAYARALSERTGLPAVRICRNYGHVFHYGKSVILPSIFDFVSLIDNAKYVLTDSFHGVALSMNLNTPPLCVYQARPGRLASLLRLVGEERRAISGFDDFDILNRPVDFTQVNRVLEAERRRVDAYLSSFLPNESN